MRAALHLSRPEGREGKYSYAQSFSPLHCRAQMDSAAAEVIRVLKEITVTADQYKGIYKTKEHANKRKTQ
jgi:hypothetical protein